MSKISDIKQKLVDEMASRNIAGMSYADIDIYARTLNTIAMIQDRSFADSYADLAKVLAANSCMATGGERNE